MGTRAIAILSILFVSAASLLADVNILVIGSTHSYCEGEKRGANEGALDVSSMADCLRRILAGDPKIKGAANVVFEDVFRKKTLPTGVGGGGKMMTMEYRCYSLAQYYFWPDGRAERLANLSGKGKAKWNYVILVGDPYLLTHMPGVYAEGVKLIADKVREGTAKPILVMPWATDKAGTDHMAEVVYRVGKGSGIPVAPAGRAWTALMRKGKASSAAGAYLAAACVYSEICGRTATGNTALAGLALETVTANKTKAQFTGRFESPNPFAMKYVTKSSITYNHTGT
ncbi:hypothetical protein HQ560_22335, partial [bacterium]|nr:hypothetical protein [bacterium]